ncbi:hypothetical protein BDW68DRAFT_193020 [Aspergillus falconensis]
MDQSAPSPPAGTWHTAKIAVKPSQVVRRVGHYKQDQIIERLQEPMPLHEGHLPTSGFQLVVPSATLDAINEALGLSNHYHHYSSVLSGAIGMFQMPDEGCIQPPPGPDFSSITTMLSYIPATNTTHGIPYFDPLFTQFYNIIAEFEMCPHPLLLLLLLLLLPLLACELTLDINVDRATGYGILNERQDDLLDHRMLVTHLSKARSWVHLALATLRSTQWCVEFILKKIDWVDERLTPETRGRLKNMYGGGSMQMDASRALRERAAFHCTLFSLITQNDSLLSTSIAQDSGEIAAASKRDSSSMKISAFLTTFVLPATFVAVCQTAYLSKAMLTPIADILLHATLRLGHPEHQPCRHAPLLGLLGACGSAYACDNGWDRGLGGLAFEEYEGYAEKGENKNLARQLRMRR